MNSHIFMKKLAIFIVGLYFMSIGVVFSVIANLGVSPISCAPYVYSLGFPLTLGQTTIVFNALLVVLQMLLLRRQYQPFQLLQLPVVFLFGLFIDFNGLLLHDFAVHGYIAQILLCLISCVVIGFGVFLEVTANLTFLPGEGVALAISKIFKMEFGKAKIGTDVSLVIVGGISSVVLMSSVQGIREGTVLSALLIGYMVRIFSRIFPSIANLFQAKKVHC